MSSTFIEIYNGGRVWKGPGTPYPKAERREVRRGRVRSGRNDFLVADEYPDIPGSLGQEGFGSGLTQWFPMY